MIYKSMARVLVEEMDYPKELLEEPFKKLADFRYGKTSFHILICWKHIFI